MGRYKKSKISGDVSLLEVPPSLGVRTRAKTLALQQQQQQSDSSSFLQLRNRRLHKPSFPQHQNKPLSNEFFEPSCADNCFDFERLSRESTPCSLVRDSGTVATPGSSTRIRNSTATYQRQSNIQICIPTSREMEEFFAFAEQQQQKLFMEKYNFDVVNGLPLTGRYEWIPVNP